MARNEYSFAVAEGLKVRIRDVPGKVTVKAGPEGKANVVVEGPEEVLKTIDVYVVSAGKGLFIVGNEPRQQFGNMIIAGERGVAVAGNVIGSQISTGDYNRTSSRPDSLRAVNITVTVPMDSDVNAVNADLSNQL